MSTPEQSLIDNEQAFIAEVMNKKPQFETAQDAFNFYHSKLEMIAEQTKLTIAELIIKADGSGQPSQLEELALELNLKLSALRKSL